MFSDWTFCKRLLKKTHYEVVCLKKKSKAQTSFVLITLVFLTILYEHTKADFFIVHPSQGSILCMAQLCALLHTLCPEGLVPWRTPTFLKTSLSPAENWPTLISPHHPPDAFNDSGAVHTGLSSLHSRLLKGRNHAPCAQHPVPHVSWHPVPRTGLLKTVC